MPVRLLVQRDQHLVVDRILKVREQVLALVVDVECRGSALTVWQVQTRILSLKPIEDGVNHLILYVFEVVHRAQAP